MIYTKYHSPAYSLDDLLNKAEQDNNELALAIAYRAKDETEEAYESGHIEGFRDGYEEGLAEEREES